METTMNPKFTFTNKMGRNFFNCKQGWNSNVPAIDNNDLAGETQDITQYPEEISQLIELGRYTLEILKLQKPKELEILRAKELVLFSQIVQSGK